jgi:WD40 repeat protein
LRLVVCIPEGVGIVRWWRLALVVAAGLAAAAAVTAVAVAVNALTGGTAGWYRVVERHPLWWTVGATAAAAVTALMAWRAQAWYERRSAELVPAVRPPEPWVVDRPDEVSQIVAALGKGGTVGITTAVQGAGGFGKTTIAKMVRADPRILHEFKGRVYWVTVGRDAAGDGLALLVNGLIARIDPDRSLTAPDAVQAAEQLAAVLATGPRRLLVLDDVWTDEQLAAFPLAGQTARLVTTRNGSLAGGGGVMARVKVDQMSQAQALALLQAGLRPLPGNIAAALVAEMGRWPLLLQLVNKVLADQVKLDSDISSAARKLLVKLRQGGKLGLGTTTGPAGKRLDVADSAQRSKAVRATIEASTGLLSPVERDRLAELAVFAEDETIPVTLITALWQAISGLDEIDARSLCIRLADLALLTLAPGADSGAITMHDVIRDYLREQLGAARLAQLHAILLAATAGGLPSAPALTKTGHATVTAWWEMPVQARYLREHLIEHLLAAGRSVEAEDLAADLRWAGMRLALAGPAGAYADLALIGTPRTRRLSQVLGQASHLLAPTNPPHSLTDILYSRVSHDPEWGVQAMALSPGRDLPALSNKWPPPDLPIPALRRTLASYTESVLALTVAPDGSWLATADCDGMVRIWDPANGRMRIILAGHNGPVRSVAVAPDGSWLASGGHDGTVRIWDPVTGRQRTALTGHKGAVNAVAVAPDGSWLASGGHDGTVRIWDPVTGRQRTALTGHKGAVNAVAVAPDGSWLASGGHDGTVRIWDPGTGRQRTLTGGEATVWSVAVAPDGSWLATADFDGMVRIWDSATGRQRTALTASDRSRAVWSVAVAPDGSWLATAGDPGVVRIWDPATGQLRTALVGHEQEVLAVAVAPDGSWLATAGYDGAVRIWDPATQRSQPDIALTELSRPIFVVFFAPDGSWLASVDADGKLQIWDPVTGRVHAALTGGKELAPVMPDRVSGVWEFTVRIWDSATDRVRSTRIGYPQVRSVATTPDASWLADYDHGRIRIWDPVTGWEHIAIDSREQVVVNAVAMAPDGSWLASGGHDGTLRIWDRVTGRQRSTLTGHKGPVQAVAIAPDGAWLASGGYDGTVRIWDSVTGRQRATLTGHKEAVWSVAIAPDGAWLASGGYDGTVRIWDSVTGRQRVAFGGHEGAVQAVAITADGAWLASVGDDRTVRIWDPADSNIKALMRVDHPLVACAWSPSGDSLAAAGAVGLYLFTFKS